MVGAPFLLGPLTSLGLYRLHGIASRLADWYQIGGAAAAEDSVTMAACLQHTLAGPQVGVQRQQASPLPRVSSFYGISVASSSNRPQLSLSTRSRRQSRLHAAGVYASVKAPWEGAPPARYVHWVRG